MSRMAEIRLSQGKVALVDDADLPALSGKKWTLHSEGYAYSWDRSTKPLRCLLMHRVITKAPDGRDVDHKNHNRLDNRRSNLRIASRTLNNYNRSSVRGFERSKYWNGFVVRVCHNYQRYYIGRFTDEAEASHVAQSVRKQLMEVC